MWLHCLGKNCAMEADGEDPKDFPIEEVTFGGSFGADVENLPESKKKITVRCRIS